MHRNRREDGGCQGSGLGGGVIMGTYCLTGKELQFYKRKRILEMYVVMVPQYECT